MVERREATLKAKAGQAGPWRGSEDDTDSVILGYFQLLHEWRGQRTEARSTVVDDGAYGMRGERERERETFQRLYVILILTH